MVVAKVTVKHVIQTSRPKINETNNEDTFITSQVDNFSFPLSLLASSRFDRSLSVLALAVEEKQKRRKGEKRRRLQ